jgi:hypothetical protein
LATPKLAVEQMTSEVIFVNHFEFLTISNQHQVLLLQDLR